MAKAPGRPGKSRPVGEENCTSWWMKTAPCAARGSPLFAIPVLASGRYRSLCPELPQCSDISTQELSFIFYEHQTFLNSPYTYPKRHWELDESGQPTQKIVEKRRRADFITPIWLTEVAPKAGKKVKDILEQLKNANNDAPPGGNVSNPTPAKSPLVGRILLTFGALTLPCSGAAVLFAGGGAEGIVWWRWVAVLLWLALGVGLWWKLPKARRWWTPWVLFLCGLGAQVSVRPSLDRDWSEDQGRVAWVDIQGDDLHFHNIRNFDYHSSSEWTANWSDAHYKLSELEAAYFIVEHFSPGVDAIAHTFVSFRFKGDRFLPVSVEILKEKEEAYSPVRGLFRQFELYYVAATEWDAVRLRTHHRESRVAIHPLQTNPERLRAYFMDVVHRMNKLKDKPEYYHTVTSSCTTNLARHLESVTPHRVLFDKRVYLPGYSSELAWELGMLGEGSLEDIMARDNVTDDERALAKDRDTYSLRIRGEVPPEPVVETPPGSQ